jgi:hypothetical protein
MAGEERQRELREQGSRPAQAQQAEEARGGREALVRVEGERAAEQRRSPDEETPKAEEDPDRPTPRR